MTANGVFQLVLYVVVLLALAKPLGGYMARVYEGRPFGLDRVLGPVERLIYRLAGVRPDQEMDWKTYAIAMLIFNFAGLFAVYALQRFQHVLPLNPQGLGPVSPDSSFNTAVSFATNTNWQGYGGETTMSYLTQMLGLTVQNFVSAAAGMATLIAFIRGFVRRSAQTIGNFWVDLTRSTLYILLPLSLVLAIALVSQGVVQTFGAYVKVNVVQQTSYDEPVTDPDGKPVLDEKGQPTTKKSTLTEQVLAVGPAASQIAIKQLGTNGGGFFNVNSAHPFENATPFSNFLEVLAILVISAALCYTFGVMVGDTRQGWVVLAAMTVIFVTLLAVCAVSEQAGNPLLAKLGNRSTSIGGPLRREHGGQRGPLRHRQLGAVGDRDHLRLQRLGQLHARFLHPARRAGADVVDAARRGGVRGRGLRLVRNAGLRHHRGLRGRTDGRPDTGVSRQEDRGLRDEDGGAHHPDSSGRRADRRRRRRHD